MLDRWVWTMGSLAFLGSGCASNAPPRSPAGPAAAPPTAEARGESAPEFPPGIAKMMDDGPCQSRLRLPLDQHVSSATDAAGAHPFLISVGEKLCLVGDSPDALKLVDKPVADTGPGSKWISAEFQIVEGLGSVLVVRHHFDGTLRYRAIIKVPNRPAGPTSVCPVRAKIASVEHWPYTIELVAFGAFAPLGPGEPAVCR